MNTDHTPGRVSQQLSWGGHCHHAPYRMAKPRARDVRLNPGSHHIYLDSPVFLALKSVTWEGLDPAPTSGLMRGRSPQPPTPSWPLGCKAVGRGLGAGEGSRRQGGGVAGPDPRGGGVSALQHHCRHEVGHPTAFCKCCSYLSASPRSLGSWPEIWGLSS